MMRQLNLVAFHLKDCSSDEASKVDVRIRGYQNSKPTGTWYSL